MRDVVLHNIVGVEACILDGELFAVDNETNTPLKFGKNKTVALEGETGGNHLMYVVFDILYIE